MADKPGGHEVGRVSIRVVPDTSGFRRRLKDELEAIEKTLKTQVEVTPEMAGFREKIKAATAGLKTDVDVDVKRGALERLRETIGKIADKVGGAGGNLSFGSGINPAGYGAIFAGIAAVAAPAVGLLTASLLTLPGLLTAVVAPAGAVALGLDGIKKAAENAGLLGEGKKGKTTLGENLKALQSSVSDVFVSRLTPVFEKLDNLFPSLKSSLPSIANGLSDVASAFVDTVTSAPGMAKIESIINNIGNAISLSAPGIGKFTDGLLSLTNSLTAKLPAVSEWFNRAGNSFADWVQRITADGTLSKAFDGLGSTLKTLLEALGGLASEGLKYFQNPQSVEDFNAGLRSVAQSVQSIVTLSNQLNNMGDLFKNLTPSFDMSGISADLLKPFTSQDAGWRDMWAGIKQTAVEAFGGIAYAASTAAAKISSFISDVVEDAKTIGSRIADAVGDLGGVLVNAGKSLMDGLGNGIRQGLASVLEFAGTIAAQIAKVKGPLPKDRTELIPQGQALMEGLGTGMANGFQSVLDQAKSMAEQISQAIKDGTNLSSILGGDKLPELKKMLDTIDEQRKQLKVDLNNTSDKGAKQSIRDQMAALLAERNVLDLQQEKLTNERKYGDASATQDHYNEILGNAANIPVDFAKTVGTQALSDLGFSGNGALEQVGNTLLDWGMNAGKKFVFNVGSGDEALSMQRTLQNREALQYDRR
ncbi:hypothetical protein B1R94_22165 [Mycolicibacterium litorale]|nr:hypothetical protein B1R94_22165 [Mycolicibacterium litorale]